MIDIGTGDGRFVSVSAKSNPDKFFIGIDANVKPLEKPSMKATRKPSKGGLPNALFVQAAVEELPGELNGVANKIYVNFPWGSLLQAVANASETVIRGLRRSAAGGCILEINLGIDTERDKTEIERLGIPALTENYIQNVLFPEYQSLGFTYLRHHRLEAPEWQKIETTWAKKLQGGSGRMVTRLVFRAT